MSIATDQLELAAVNTAIEAILLGGQDIRRGDASVRQADLASLYRRKDQLQARIDRAALTGGGIRVRGATPI